MHSLDFLELKYISTEKRMLKKEEEKKITMYPFIKIEITQYIRSAML